MALNAKLVVVGGEVKTAEIKLRLPSTIGRGRGTSIMLPHPLVSRQHCELFEAGGKLMVRDMGSLNGTFVNNQRITESVILPGELLTIGAVTFRAAYELDEAAAPGIAGGSPSDTNIASRGALDSTVPAEAMSDSGELVEEFADLDVEEIDPLETSSVSQPISDLLPPGADEVVDVPDIEEEADDGSATRMASDPRATQPAPAKQPTGKPAGASAPAPQKGITPPGGDGEADDEEEDDLQDFLNSLK